MRTGTGILTRDDVNVIVNDDIWYEELTRCLTVASLASVENHLSVHNISYTLDSAYSGSSYRLIPYDKISFTTTPITGPTTYPFNIFFDTSSTSAMSSAIFSGALVIYQGSSAPNQSFSFSVNYQTGTSVNLSYQGSAISESVFNQLYFFITGGWSPSYTCKCTIFKTKGTSFAKANNYKTTTNLINSSNSSTTVSTQGSPFKLSLIGTYNEFKQGLLGLLIYLERTS